jgi:hypothetical protein
MSAPSAGDPAAEVNPENGAAGRPGIADLPTEALSELAPMLRRAVGLDRASVARLRVAPTTVTGWVRLPFDVLVGRTVTRAGPAPSPRRAADVTASAVELLAWIDKDTDIPPPPRDADWRGGTPPTDGWARVDLVPDGVIRGLVRKGALALKEAAAREGVPGAQPRAETTRALLDAVVLTVTGPSGARVDVTLRLISAVTRMGFMPRGSDVAIDLAGRWQRVTAQYGSGYAERPGLGLTLRP